MSVVSERGQGVEFPDDDAAVALMGTLREAQAVLLREMGPSADALALDRDRSLQLCQSVRDLADLADTLAATMAVGGVVGEPVDVTRTLAAFFRAVEDQIKDLLDADRAGTARR